MGGGAKMTEHTLSILVHAPPKVGKSTLSSTAPHPLLVLDAEGGWRFIAEAGFRSGVKLRKITWDPNQGPPPKHDDSWDACVVTVRNWQTLQNAYVWLTQAPHDFRSLVLDSITEVQRRCKENLRGTEQMRIQDWGDLLTRMDSLIRGFRDLILLPGNVRCVIFIAETREDKGKWRPYMQGQISISLPYWMDLVGYLYVEAEPDAEGQATRPVRKLLVGPHPQFESGERVQGVLGDVVREPHLAHMIQTIFDNVEVSE